MSSELGREMAAIFDRDLGRLADQLRAYPDEASLWRVGGTTKNPAGTLAWHLVGNLDCYVGAVLGGTGYVRDREAEFADRDVPRETLLERIEGTRAMIRATLPALSDEALAGAYPAELPPAMAGATTRGFLLHLLGHLSWHLGQVDYHRRLLVEGAGSG